MIFPIGDDQVKGGPYPIFSYAFIAINLLIFLYQINLPPYEMQMFVDRYDAEPDIIRSGNGLLNLITCMFFHGDWGHIIFNMLYLWVFADNIEQTIGNFTFVLYYLSGGVISALIHLYVESDSSLGLIGASGAISAVMGTYFILFPSSRIRTLFFVIPFKVPAVIFLGLWIYMQLNSGLDALNVSEGPGSNVAWWAHIGGFIYGVLVGIYIRLTGRLARVSLVQK